MLNSPICTIDPRTTVRSSEFFQVFSILALGRLAT